MERRLGAQDAEDVLQDAMVRLLEHPAPASIHNPRAFLYQVSAHLATDRERARAVRARHHEAVALDQIASGAPGPEALAAQHKRLGRIATAKAASSSPIRACTICASRACSLPTIPKRCSR